MERMSSMAKRQKDVSVAMLDDLHTSGAGYDILRYISLPGILGTEASTLLYFMGKDLARKLKPESLHDVYYTFEKLCWGRLDYVKEKRKAFLFTLMPDAVMSRLIAPINHEFRVVAGFIVESIQMIKEQPCECKEEINNKIHQVVFTVFVTES